MRLRFFPIPPFHHECHICFTLDQSVTAKPENTNLTTAANTSAVLLNSQVTFHCSADGSPPPHNYLLTLNGEVLASNSSGYFSIQITESGNYSCVPVNKAGNGEVDSIAIIVVGA